MPGPLGLTDVEFWDDPRRTEDEVQDRLLDEGFLGVVIDAPARVPLAKRQTLPVCGVRATTLRENRDLSIPRATVAAASCLETHDVRAGPAFAQKERLGAPPVGDDDPGEGVTIGNFETDLRARLGVPWQAGTWVVTFLVRERASNRVMVKLEAGGGGGFVDPAAAALLAARRRPRYPQPIGPRAAPGQPLPAYRARPDSPPVPDAPGIALAVERLVKDGEDAQVVVRGSFRLPALEREVVKPADPADAAALEALDEAARAQALRDGVAWQDPGDAAATAVIPITVVVTGVERAGPLVVRLQAPSFDPVDPTADVALVTGHFALDLLAQRGGELLRDQTSFIYALCGEALAGPATVAVVDPRLVG